MDIKMNTSTHRCNDTVEFINTIIRYKENDYNTLLVSKYVCLATKYNEQVKIYFDPDEDE